MKRLQRLGHESADASLVERGLPSQDLSTHGSGSEGGSEGLNKSAGEVEAREGPEEDLGGGDGAVHVCKGEGSTLALKTS